MEIMKSLRPKVIPPTGWVAQTREGVLRRNAPDAEDGGMLARLDAVVRFLMERDSLPCSEAVKTICTRLQVDAAMVLYMVQQQGFAIAVTERVCFDPVSVGGNSGRVQRAGRAGAIDAMLNCWGSEPACSVYDAAGLDCLAVPLLDASKAWGYGEVHALRPMWPLSMSDVQWNAEPLEGWVPNASNGLLRHDSGNECRLVRLVDLAAWMANEYPRDDVNRRLFGALYQNEADPWGWQLFVLNSKGYAQRLFDHGGVSPETADFWSQLHEPDSVYEYPECVTSGYADQEVVDVIGRMWGYAWPGVGANPDADREWYMRRVTEANRRRNERVKLNPDASRTSAPASMLSEERQAMMRLLDRLAVPIPIAFTLWGWGRAVAAAAPSDAVAGTQAAPAVIEAQDVSDWPSLVRYRQQFAPVKGEKRKPLGWPFSQVEILAERLRQECRVSMRGALQRLAKESGLSRQSMQQALERNGFNDATGEKALISGTDPKQLVRIGRR